MEINYNPTRFTDVARKLNYKDTITIRPGQLSASDGIDGFRQKLRTYSQSSDSSIGLVVDISRDCRYNDFIEICDMLNIAYLQSDLLGNTIKVSKFRSHYSFSLDYDYIGGRYPPGYPFSKWSGILGFVSEAVFHELRRIQREIDTIQWAAPAYILIISWSILFAFGARSLYLQFENRRYRTYTRSFAAAPNSGNQRFIS